MGGTCSKWEGDKKCIQNLVGKPQVKRQLGDLGRDGKMMLKRILEKWC
jgi:hypothetical protein